MKNEILDYLLGDLTISFLIGFYIFALLGVIFSMLLHFGKKHKKAPVVFSWSYWLKDNAVRFFTSFISIFVVCRFFSELPINMELNMFLGLVVGVTLDQVVIMIRNKT